MKDYIVGLVFSSWQLSKLVSFFSEYLDSKNDDIGCLKIERFKDKKRGIVRDSNRTLILMKKPLFEKAIEAGLDYPQPNLDFRIAEYQIHVKSYPAEGYTTNLFIILSKTLSSQEVENGILEKMKSFVDFGLLGNDEFQFKIPLESRFTGEHRGFAYLEFDPRVELNSRLLIKALLNDSFIYLKMSKKLYHLPVFWAKNKLY